MHAFKENQKRVAIVHATGTGKSYVISTVAQNFKRVLVIAPNDYVLNETQKVCHAGCDFRTYTSTINHSTEHNQYDLIVLDEFHRTGASKWGIGVQNIMTTNPNALLFGTTATPVRNLDKGRNMADELFDGHVVSRLTMKDAIDQGILADPVYVRSIYSFDEFENKIKQSKKKGLDKESLIKQLSVVRDNWKNAGGVSAIIRKHYNHNMKRVIVFSNSIKKVKPIRELLALWFREAGFENVKFYTIHSQMTNSDKQMAQFQEDEDGVLKVAITVNMLNEGVHIPRVDGIIMLRSSMSNIIVSQQIGRCMSAGNKDLRPVILDLVNNMELILQHHGEDEDAHSSESGSRKKGKKTKRKDEHSEEFPFKVIDECMEFRDVIQQIGENLSLRHHTKEECIASAKKYTNRRKWAHSKEDGRFCAYAQRHGWYEECCAHMRIMCSSHTLEECIASAKKYSTRTAWKESKEDGKFHGCALQNGWMELCCKHMPKGYNIITNSSPYIDLDDCKKSALKYRTLTEWLRSEDRKLAYTAKANNWLQECCAHMLTRDKTKHTKKECIASAKKYSTRTAWQKSKTDSKYYYYANNRRWLDQCCKHMKKKYARPCKYTKEICLASALKYSTRTEWENSKDSNYYYAAHRYGWYEECCQHMKKDSKIS